MSAFDLKRVIMIGVAAAIVSGAVGPALATTRGEQYANVAPGDNRCYTDEGYGRRAICGSGG